MKIMICNQSDICEESQYCAATDPHFICEQCDGCSVNQFAKCIPYTEYQRGNYEEK